MKMRTMALLAAGAVLLTGCSGGGPATGGDQEPGAEPTGLAAAMDKAEARWKKQSQETEAALVVCMKGKGFTYSPYTWDSGRTETPEQKARRNGDYEAEKRFRTKFGFGTFARMVFPDDPEFKMTNSFTDPNEKYLKGLPEKQRMAFYKARERCELEALQKKTGKKIKSMEEYWKSTQKVRDARTSREIDGNPELIQLGQAYSTCLKGKGYQVTETKPSKLQYYMQETVWKDYEKATKNKGMMIEKNGKVTQPMTPVQAKPYLDKEIKIAMDDLDCGKDFRTPALLASMRLQEKLDAELGAG
ncbi:hypothetical protein ACIBG8_10025 [Nonomuraea sp. NPDC050556]|uniref:hypothetical protein n=1 Tax=Nonomuraea sp. NPDC050556 TaxID=3364369 RepID=UPI00379FA383